MRNTLIAAVMAAAVAAPAGAAMAQQVEGMILRTDDARHLVLLDNGERLTAAAEIDTSTLEWGEWYAITVSVVNGKPVATWFERIDHGTDVD
jgi:outer membrane lipoprotein SlyB